MSIFKKKQEEDKEVQDKKTAQAFTNIRDVRGNFLYTMDGYIFTYIRLAPIAIDLLSIGEKKAIATSMTAEMSRETKGYTFHAFDRAIDIKPLITSYQNIKECTDKSICAKILDDEMTFLGALAQNGDIFEKQFLFSLWEKYRPGIESELAKRAEDFMRHLEAGRLHGRIMSDVDSRQMGMFYFNPSLSHLDNGSYNPAIPFMNADIEN